MSKIMDKFLKNCNNFFYIGYFLLVFSDMFNKLPIVNKYHDIMILSGIFLIILFNGIILLINYKKQSFCYYAIIIFLAIISFISYLSNHNFTLIKLFLLFLSISNLRFDEFIKKDLLVKTFFLIVIIILFNFGVLTNQSFFRTGGVSRYALGLDHPNTLGFYLMILGIELLYLNRKKKSLFRIILSFALFFLIIWIPSSRTSAILLLIYIVYYIFNPKIFNKKIVQQIMVCSFVIFSIISLTLGYSYRYHLPKKINSMLSNRPEYYNGFLINFRINAFGNEIPTNYKGMFLDNAYLKLLLNFGIVQYGVILILNVLGMKRNIKQKNYFLATAIFITLISGTMEILMINGTINPLILGLIPERKQNQI